MNAGKNQTPEASSKEHTLAEFIEDNHKLITVLGVFTALTVFSSTLELRAFGYVLSFLFMTLTVFVWLELWSRLPGGRTTWRLVWFQYIFTFTLLALLGYWLLFYRTIWHTYLIYSISALLLAGILSVVWRHKVFDRIFGAKSRRRRLLQTIVGMLLVLLVLVVVVYLAGALAEPMNRVLDALRATLESTAP